MTHQQLMRRRIAWMAPALFVLMVLAYATDIPPFGPTPWQARAALVKRGWCKPETPITWQNGELLIGNIRYYGCSFQVGNLPTMESRGRFTYSWDISFSTPFGHWVVDRSLDPVC